MLVELILVFILLVIFGPWALSYFPEKVLDKVLRYSGYALFSIFILLLLFISLIAPWALCILIGYLIIR